MKGCASEATRPRRGCFSSLSDATWRSSSRSLPSASTCRPSVPERPRMCKNNITTRAEYKQSRALALNMSNAQVTETTSNDLTLDFSMTKDKFKLPIKIKGRTVSFENALTMRISMTVRDAETIQRRVSADDQTTTGSNSFQIRPSMTYKLNKSLDLTMYFDRNVNEPKVNGFKTATTSFGTQLRFSLAQ